MALTKRRNNWYGDDHADLREELARYSSENEYPIDNFTTVKCQCGSDLFQLYTDEDQGVAMRICTQCHNEHLMGDSADYLARLNQNSTNATVGKTSFRLLLAFIDIEMLMVLFPMTFDGSILAAVAQSVTCLAAM